MLSRSSAYVLRGYKAAPGQARRAGYTRACCLPAAATSGMVLWAFVVITKGLPCIPANAPTTTIATCTGVCNRERARRARVG